MYSNRIPKYTIDLNKDESQRWDKVIAADTKAVLKLAEVAEAGTGLSRTMLAGLRAVVTTGYKMSGGRYQGELKSWAAALGRSFGDVLLLNCSYELSHLAEVLNPEPGTGLAKAMGCTTGVRWFPGLGMVHVRNLDWGLPLGRATRIFEYQQGKRSFVAVGVSGFVGVLSGMLPGAYSVAINSAPPDGRPRFSFGPAFLLREVLETCDTYEEAVDVLSNTPLATSVFYTVCGADKNQACVIERTRKSFAIRKLGRTPLVQANHYAGREFAKNNAMTMSTEARRDSRERARTLKRSLEETSATSLKDIAKACLDSDPVENWETEQQMVFCPTPGKMDAWRRTSP